MDGEVVKGLSWVILNMDVLVMKALSWVILNMDGRVSTMVKTKLV